MLRDTPKANLKIINDWLSNKGCPELPVSTLSDIVKNSKHLNLCGTNEVELRLDSKTRFTEMRNYYEKEVEAALELLRSTISTHIKSLEHFNFRPVVEEYLCAVCLEIRMMANYFRSTHSLFQRLEESSEFDYVLK